MVSKNIIVASAEGNIPSAGAGNDAAAGADHVHVQHQHELEIPTSASNMTDDQVKGNNIKRDDDDDRQNPEIKLNLTDQTKLLPTRQVVVVILGIASCIIVATLDTTIVATALPTIAASFDAGSVASWIPSATLLLRLLSSRFKGDFRSKNDL